MHGLVRGVYFNPDDDLSLNLGICSKASGYDEYNFNTLFLPEFNNEGNSFRRLKVLHDIIVSSHCALHFLPVCTYIHSICVCRPS